MALVFNTHTLNSLNLPLSHSVLLSHHSHSLNLAIISLSLSYTLSISLAVSLLLSLSVSLLLSVSLSLCTLALYSPSCSRFVLSLLVCIFSLESQGMSPYLNICLSIWGVRVICGSMLVFVGICGVIFEFFVFNEHFHVLLEQSVIVGHS